jgi:hypothetical protein
MVGEPLISNSIALVSCVLPAINLDHQPLGTAGEVNDVRTDRLLTNEFVAVERTRAQTVPKLEFCIGLGLAKLARSHSLELVGPAHARSPPHPDFALACEIRPLPARGER